MALLLNRSDVEKLLPMSKAIEVVESAFSELANHTAEMPPRTVMIDSDVGGWIAYMPAYLKSDGALGCKAVTVYKGNPDNFGLPTTLATILVQDSKTGKVLAAMDGGYLTAMRTGAVSGVATKHMARPDSKIGGVLGAGVQARQQAVAVAEASGIHTILSFSLDPMDARQKFGTWIAARTGVTVRLTDSAEELCREADIVSIATTATSPIVDSSWWKPGAHINGIGSHAPGVRELDSATVQKANVICDQIDACMAEAGDLQIPVENEEYSWDDIAGDLGDVVNGKIKGRTSDDEITLFKSVGLAVQDISCAALVYREALENGIGVEFDFSD